MDTSSTWTLLSSCSGSKVHAGFTGNRPGRLRQRFPSSRMRPVSLPGRKTASLVVALPIKERVKHRHAYKR